MPDILLIKNNRQKLFQGCGDYFFALVLHPTVYPRLKKVAHRPIIAMNMFVVSISSIPPFHRFPNWIESM